jgi:hypothetical protein
MLHLRAAYQRRHFGADRKLAGRAGFYDADAFDTTQRCRFGPLARRMCSSAWLMPNALIWMTT